MVDRVQPLSSAVVEAKGSPGLSPAPLSEPPPRPKPESGGLTVQQWKSLGACLFYGTVSLSLTFVNKAVFQTAKFKYYMTVAVVQQLFSIVTLSVLGLTGRVKIRFSVELFLRMWPVGLFFYAMVPSGLGALRYLSVPMFSALRRATTLIVMVLEYAVGERKPANLEAASVVTMVLGAMLAALGDFQFTGPGYILVFTNCAVTAGHLACIKRFSKSMSEAENLFYMNAWALPTSLVTAYATGEADAMMEFEGFGSTYFWVFFILSAVQGLILNYAIVLCTDINSPLATSVTGQIKTILQDVFGVLLFGGITFGHLNTLGLSVSLAASIWYSTIKYQQGQAKRRAAAKAQEAGRTGV